jgi:hypothetical protein
MSHRIHHWTALLCAVTLAFLVGCNPASDKKTNKTGKSPKTQAKTAAPKTETKTEPKTEEEKTAAKTEEAKTETVKTEEAKTEPMKTEPKTEEAKTEPKTEEVKTEAKTEGPKTEAKTETVKTEAKTEPMKTEPKTEEAKTEAKTEAAKTEEPKTEAKTEPMKTETKTEEAKTEAKTEEKPDAAKPAESAAKPLKKTELLVTLPESCNTPDGMALLADNSVIVSVPNFNDQKQPPLLVKITPDNKVEEFLKLPAHPDTGRMGPMGIRPAPSGDLYLADNQLFHGKDGKNLFGKSRIVRIPMKDGKPGEIVPVVTGLNVANAVAIHDGYVYLTETILVPESKPLVSGVFRFKLGDEGIKMKEPLKDDPHLLFTLETQGSTGFGADGICFDGKGNLYVSDFTDGVIYRATVDKDGKVGEKKLFAKADFMKSCDGMDYDPKTDKIYSADLMGNGVNCIDMEGKVQRLAENPDSDGAGGQLRAACEALVRGNTIVVANMDFPVPGAVVQKYSKPATISVIKLE